MPPPVCSALGGETHLGLWKSTQVKAVSLLFSISFLQHTSSAVKVPSVSTDTVHANSIPFSHLATYNLQEIKHNT